MYELGNKVIDALVAFQECDFTEDVTDERGKPEISLRISRHALSDIHIGSILSWLEYNDVASWEQAIEAVKVLMPDLGMELLSWETYDLEEPCDKYIYCKVRFGTSSKLYSYRTDDPTLEVGDVVKVPVGKDNDIGYATIEEIGYFT